MLVSSAKTRPHNYRLMQIRPPSFGHGVWLLAALQVALWEEHAEIPGYTWTRIRVVHPKWRMSFDLLAVPAGSWMPKGQPAHDEHWPPTQNPARPNAIQGRLSWRRTSSLSWSIFQRKDRQRDRAPFTLVEGSKSCPEKLTWGGFTFIWIWILYSDEIGRSQVYNDHRSRSTIWKHTRDDDDTAS